MYPKRCLFLLLLTLPLFLRSQCTITGPVLIPDDDVITLGVLATGLIDANLASPTQGICGVHIEFTHEYLGDLTMTLVSPSGTAVTLVGPTTTATFPTNLTTWDIDFIPCGTPANPDPGFADMWSNLQAWNSLAFYSGAYHPQTGCLENFNTGPANGIWQLIVQDHSVFQTGTVISFSLTFCNPAGLSCEPCSPNAGVLSPASLALCTGENIMSSDFVIDYGMAGPPTSEYLYHYLLISGTNIVQYGSFFSASLAAGDYRICGLSYAEKDTTFVNAVLESGDYAILQQIIQDGNVCGQLSATCVSVHVEEPPDTIRVSSSLCQGEVFTYGGQNYTNTGAFYQVHDGPGMCDTVVEIRIFPRNLTVDIPPGDTLSCGGNQINLAANVSGAAGPFMYQWSTMFGNITSASNLPAVTVDQAGLYMVSVTDGICSGVASTTVHANPGYPQVFVEGATLSCAVTVVDIAPIFIPSDGTAMWTGPMGFVSNQANIQVSVPGTYFLTITNRQGCSTTESVFVGTDTITYPVSIYELPKNCPAGTCTFGVATGISITDFTWSGPNGFVYNAYNPTVSDAGLYALTVTFENGCTRTTTHLFDGDFTVPDLMVPVSDTLHCSEIITLTASSLTPGITYAWSGPQAFSSNQASVQVQQTGVYQVIATAPNGCQAQGSAEVVNGSDVFDFQLFTDTLTCLADSVSIGVLSSDADVFDWLNYTGPGDSTASIRVNATGTYTVMMTDTNTSCQLLASIQVSSDYSTPPLGYIPDTITCSEPIAQIAFNPTPGVSYTGVYWELPDFTIIQGPLLNSGLTGTHILHAVSENGCVGNLPFQIPVDTLAPFLLVESDTLLCRDTARIITQSLETIVQYQWSGPGILADHGSWIEVTAPGLYHLLATGENQCVASVDVGMDSNYVKPLVAVMFDSIRCDRDAMAVATSPDAQANYVWYTPFGQVVANDSIMMTGIPSTYYVDVTGYNRCVTTDSVTFDPPHYPEVELRSDTFTCSVLQVILQSQIDVMPLSTYWIESSLDTVGASPTLPVADPGPYVLAVTGPNGCMSRDTIQVPYDTAAPSAMIEVIGEIFCQERDIMLSGATSIPVGVTYDWTSTGGSILSPSNQPQVQARDTGFYQLVVTRPDNGCKDTAMVHVLPSPFEILGALLEIMQPVCHGEHNASVTITGVTGGIEPFLYQLNGGPPQTAVSFTGLAAGPYVLTVLDAAGCAYDTAIQIPVTETFTVDAGEDQEIYLGETAHLSGTTDLPVTDITDQRWDSLSVTLCSACPDWLVAPWETATYVYTVQSATGCMVRDEITVFVIERGNYFIPNIFSPNGDNVNDEVRLYASPGISRIRQWVIFDRWGNAVYGKTDFDPGDPSVFWNGRTTTGDFANPGVFPYLIEYELINGTKELKHGDITLIR